MHAHVALEIRVDLELGTAHLALEGGVAGMCAEMDDQLTGVAAGIRTDLTPEIGMKLYIRSTEHSGNTTRDFNFQTSHTLTDLVRTCSDCLSDRQSPENSFSDRQRFL